MSFIQSLSIDQLFQLVFVAGYTIGVVAGILGCLTYKWLRELYQGRRRAAP